MSSPLRRKAVFDSATFPGSVEPIVPAPVWGQAEQLKGQMQGGEEGCREAAHILHAISWHQFCLWVCWGAGD